MKEAHTQSVRELREASEPGWGAHRRVQIDSHFDNRICCKVGVIPGAICREIIYVLLKRLFYPRKMVI